MQTIILLPPQIFLTLHVSKLLKMEVLTQIQILTKVNKNYLYMRKLSVQKLRRFRILDDCRTVWNEMKSPVDM